MACMVMLEANHLPAGNSLCRPRQEGSEWRQGSGGGGGGRAVPCKRVFAKPKDGQEKGKGIRGQSPSPMLAARRTEAGRMPEGDAES